MAFSPRMTLRGSVKGREDAGFIGLGEKILSVHSVTGKAQGT